MSVPASTAIKLQAAACAGGGGVCLRWAQPVGGATSGDTRPVAGHVERGSAEMLIESYPAVMADSRNDEVERLADEQAVLRRRLVTDADAVRRQVVRDLHDGTQQRLVQGINTLQLAGGALRANETEGERLLRGAAG